MTRVVHYINQFFAGKGGEDEAGNPPATAEGAVGPGRKLQSLLDDDLEIVTTVFCGDDYAAGQPEAVKEILDLVKDAKPDLLACGPAFTSGRYGLICARLAQAADSEGIPVVAAMHEDNPGADEAGAAVVVASGKTSREMAPSLEKMAEAIRRVAAGEAVTHEHGRIGRIPRRNTTADKPAAERAVDLLLARLGGDREATEVPQPKFDQVHPAPPVDPSEVVVALVTEGAVVPTGNPDKLESARATKWFRYSLEGVEALDPEEYQSIHGGFSTQWANEDPHRILPLDVARELVEEGAIGGLHDEYFVTAGNGTAVGNARRFGIEWAADLRHSGARAAILTST